MEGTGFAKAGSAGWGYVCPGVTEAAGETGRGRPGRALNGRLRGAESVLKTMEWFWLEEGCGLILARSLWDFGRGCLRGLGERMTCGLAGMVGMQRWMDLGET